MEQKNLRLAVKNFGPIREGEVEFKPLTVFIGPNNSGKSYMATLLYALLKALLDTRTSLYPLRSVPSHFSLSYEELEEIWDWCEELTVLSASVRSVHPLLRYFESQKSDLEASTPGTLRDYFGCQDLSELILRNCKNFSIDLSDTGASKPLVGVIEDMVASHVDVDIELDSDSSHYMEFLRGMRAVGRDLRSSISLIRELWEIALLSKEIPAGGIFYLPAGRSGLLQGWQLITSLAVGMIGRRIGIQNFEIPTFPGVARDFTQVLLGMMPPAWDGKRTDHLSHAVSLLENGALGGTIYVQAKNNTPAMVYESDGLQIPIHRTSSMISELAPIHLWMTHLLQVGDVLIIDEPEAHLHPENQRLIAQVLVRLMNAGVRVVCTTHSSLILHQMSNQILATSSGKLDGVGFTDHDKLGLEDIGVYLFEPSEGGVYVKEVEVDSDFGISEDEFVRVAEQIGDETYQLVT